MTTCLQNNSDAAGGHSLTKSTNDSTAHENVFHDRLGSCSMSVLFLHTASRFMLADILEIEALPTDQYLGILCKCFAVCLGTIDRLSTFLRRQVQFLKAWLATSTPFELQGF